MKGKVYLVGAGTGDFELLTIKAERLLKSADAIVFDSGVESSVLAMAKPSARLIEANENHGKKEDLPCEISEILVELATQYPTIVRLKVGDPFIFDGGEKELEKLVECGVDFEVVPGISSSIAVPTYAGIPVTSQDHATSLHIITSQAKGGEEVQIQYEPLVKLAGTLVFMMSVSRLGDIAKGLIGAGMQEDMPCAVIENGTHSYQRKFLSTIKDIKETADKNAVKSPAIILVGKVASLSEKLDWFSKKPLANVRILSTQKGAGSSKLAISLKGNGADVTFCPTIQSTSTLPLCFDIKDYTAVAFSSMQGVESFFECLIKNKQDARSLHNIKTACVGSQTAKALESKGIIADFIPTVFSGKDMASGMISSGLLSQNDKLLLIRPQEGSQEILEVLKGGNIQFDDIPFYKTDYQSQKHISDISCFDYVIFTSKSGVESFSISQSHLDFSNTVAVCIGDQTAESAKVHGFKVVVSEVATMDGMVAEIIKLELQKTQNK